MIAPTSSANRLTEQEQSYLAIRQAEGRLYSDAMLRHLPTIAEKTHPLAREWAIRAVSANRLQTYISEQLIYYRPLTLLDLGCGNGWLTHQLAQLPGLRVIGVDINRLELSQAANVFRHQSNLSFCYGDISAGLFCERRFDFITIMAAIQYFPNLAVLLTRLRGLLNHGGEIHILDSPFYNSKDAQQAARHRTRQHYERLGYPAMAKFYHHHRWSALQPYNPTVLYQPRPFLAKICARLNLPYVPFPWVAIRGS